MAVLACLTRLALREAWITEAETSTATMASKQRPASRVIFNWIESRLNSIFRTFI